MAMTEEQKASFLLKEMEQAEDEDLTTVTPGAETEIDAEIAASLGANTGAGEDIEEEVKKQATDAPFTMEAQGEKKKVADNDDEKINFTFSEFLDAEIGADLIAFLIPLIGVLAGKLFKFEVAKKDLKLDNAEKKTLQKPLDKAFADTTIGTKNPWLALIVVIILMVGMKLFGAYLAKEEERENNPPAPNAPPQPPTPQIKTEDLKAKPSYSGGKRGRKSNAERERLAKLTTPQSDIILQPSTLF